MLHRSASARVLSLSLTSGGGATCTNCPPTVARRVGNEYGILETKLSAVEISTMTSNGKLKFYKVMPAHFTICGPLSLEHRPVIFHKVALQLQYFQSDVSLQQLQADVMNELHNEARYQASQPTSCPVALMAGR